MRFVTHETMASTMAPMMAATKSSMRNPGDSHAVSSSMTALRTMRKNPSVTMVSGSVRKKRIGLTTEFSRPRISAAMARDTIER